MPQHGECYSDTGTKRHLTRPLKHQYEGQRVSESPGRP